MKKTYFFFYLLFLTQLVFSQSKKEHGFFDNFISDTEIFFADGGSFITYPLGMNKTQWLVTAGIGLGTYLLVRNDDYFQERIGRRNMPKLESGVWVFAKEFGVIQYAELAGAATYTFGYLTKNDDVRVLGRMIVQSLTYSGLTAMFVRMIAGRKRPPFTNNHLEFSGFESNNSFQSFPSGHTTVAFAFSTVLAEYFDTPWTRIGFYGLAGLTATQRLLNGEHWFSDVALGTLLGIASGLHVISEEKNRTKKDKTGLTISPTFNGINFQYRF
ncbi:MAG: phosphatase PAP2 family protein [Melioribacteraceae bacterium]